MRPLRYSINVTLDGCVDHRAGVPDEELHRHHARNIEQADALLLGRVTYQMMEEAWRPSRRRERGPTGCPTGSSRSPGRSTRRRSTSCRAPWTGSIGTRSSCAGTAGGRPAAQAGTGQGNRRGRRDAPAGAGGAGTDRRVRVRRSSPDRGPRTDAVRRPLEARRPEAREPVEFGSGAVAMRYVPRG